MALPHFDPPVIAHRGASAYAPENTLVAFTKAAQLGIKWLEFDVMQAASGEPVIFHDELLNRTTNGSGELCQYPYAYLRSLDAGGWFSYLFAGEKIPSLANVVEFLLNNGYLYANIEIKPSKHNEEHLIKRILHEVAPLMAFASDRVLFSSFSVHALHTLRKLSPDCQIGLLMHEWLPDWSSLCDTLQCVSVHANKNILDQKRVSEIKASQRAVLSYTVNDPETAKQLFNWGVDAVFSDQPDKIIEFA